MAWDSVITVNRYLREIITLPMRRCEAIALLSSGAITRPINKEVKGAQPCTISKGLTARRATPRHATADQLSAALPDLLVSEAIILYPAPSHPVSPAGLPRTCRIPSEGLCSFGGSGLSGTIPIEIHDARYMYDGTLNHAGIVRTAGLQGVAHNESGSGRPALQFCDALQLCGRSQKGKSEGGKGRRRSLTHPRRTAQLNHMVIFCLFPAARNPILQSFRHFIIFPGRRPEVP